ncbi:hypothetical protein V8E53_004026 [Lactarius tabidus]
MLIRMFSSEKILSASINSCNQDVPDLPHIIADSSDSSHLSWIKVQPFPTSATENPNYPYQYLHHWTFYPPNHLTTPLLSTPTRKRLQNGNIPFIAHIFPHLSHPKWLRFENDYPAPSFLADVFQKPEVWMELMQKALIRSSGREGANLNMHYQLVKLQISISDYPHNDQRWLT